VRDNAGVSVTEAPQEVPADPGGGAPSGRSPATEPPAPRIPHVAGLDGLRGLAVIGVLLFHGGFSWMSGGYLGVSLFFTLSGYLITSLLLAERAGTGRVDLAAFWSRRIRRLLPASLVTLAGVAVWSATFAPDLQRVHLRGDLLGSLFYVANWRLLARGSSYAEIQSAPSLVQHFWSLAIEEQFYVLWPLVVAVVLARWGRRGLGWTSGVLLAGSVASCLVLWDVVGASTDAVYYGTGTRAAELLVGALLAIDLPVSRAVAAPVSRTRQVQWLGVAALVAMVVLWATVEQGDEWQYQGGFALHALLAAAVIAAVVHPGVLGRVLSWEPLRAVGLVSYGLYLYHWPVFVVLDEDRLDMDGPALFAVRMAVTTVMTVVSYRLVEQPIRRGRLFPGNRIWIAAVAGMGVVAALALLGTRNPPQIAYGDVRPTIGAVSVVTAPPPPEGATTTPPGPTDPDGGGSGGGAAPFAAPATLMTIGDSGMYDATPALRASFFSSGTQSSIEAAYPGVGLTNGVGDWRTEWARIVTESRPGLVVVMLGGFDLEYLEENGPEAYGLIVGELLDLLTAEGGKVAWLSMLPCGNAPDQELNATFAAVAAEHPGDVAFVDTAPAFPGCTIAEEVPGQGLVPIRKPDLWHLCPLGAERFATFVHAAVAELGWAPPAVDGWQGGDWRLEARYDDPPGGCAVG